MSQRDNSLGRRRLATRRPLVHGIHSVVSLAVCLSLAIPQTTWAQGSGAVLSMTSLTCSAAVQAEEEDHFAHMSFRQRERLARRVFRQAEGHKRRGQLDEAIEKYEQAYRLVPHKHGLAFIIGMAYQKAGSCERAGHFLDRLIKHGGTEARLQDKISRARDVLSELSAQGCWQGGAPAKSDNEAPLLVDPDDETAPEPEPEQDEYEDESDEEATPVYDGPTVNQATLDENPLGESSQSARKKSQRDFRRANSRGFLISGIILASLGIIGLGGAGFLHWKSHDTAKRIIKLTDVDPTTRFPVVAFGCRGMSQKDAKSLCPRVLIKDFKFYQKYTPIAYGVGGGLLGLGLTFILIKQIRLARYRRRAEGKLSWHHPERLDLSPYRVGQRIGAQATLRF